MNFVRQPQFYARLNPYWIAQGLDMCVLFLSGAPAIDLMGRHVLTPTGWTQKTIASGKATSKAAVTNFYSVSPALSCATGFTFAVNSENTTWSPGEFATLGVDTTLFRALLYNAGTLASWGELATLTNFTGHTLDATGAPTTHVVTGSASACRSYKNGVEYSNADTFATTRNFNNVFGQTGQSRAWNASTVLLYFTRPLPAILARALSTNIWQVFAPANDRRYWAVAAGGGGGSILPAMLQQGLYAGYGMAA